MVGVARVLETLVDLVVVLVDLQVLVEEILHLILLSKDMMVVKELIIAQTLEVEAVEQELKVEMETVMLLVH